MLLRVISSDSKIINSATFFIHLLCSSAQSTPLIERFFEWDDFVDKDAINQRRHCDLGSAERSNLFGLKETTFTQSVKQLYKMMFNSKNRSINGVIANPALITLNLSVINSGGVKQSAWIKGDNPHPNV